MIWAVVLIEAGVVALCVYQIRELTARLHFTIDLQSRTIALVEKLNDIVKEAAETLNDATEQIGLQQIRVANNEHRIRDIYKAINELKGWPGNDLSE